MKVLLVGNYVPDRQYSMLGFCRMLELELRRAGLAVSVIRPEPRLRRSLSAGQGLAKWLGYVDKFVLFPARLRTAAKNADVVHVCDQGYALYTRHLEGIPNVVTCHDLIAARCALGEFSEMQTSWSGRRYQNMIINGLAQARHVVCDSESTARDVRRLCNLMPSATSVVHMALNFAYQPVNEAEREIRLGRLGIGFRDRFILHVGGDTWYKNQSGVVKIFQRLDAAQEARGIGLVMVSGGLTAPLRRVIGKCGLQQRVRVLSGIEPEDLRALYSAAAALLFPSLCEGFGWPIIEAQACGCPVFTSNRAPMTEVGGDGAVYIDPENPEKAARTILESLPDGARMREAGFANVRRFSAQKMVAGYVSAYAEAMRSVLTPRSGQATDSTGKSNANVRSDSGEPYPHRSSL